MTRGLDSKALVYQHGFMSVSAHTMSAIDCNPEMKQACGFIKDRGRETYPFRRETLIG
jgi:hypothetical protein